VHFLALVQNPFLMLRVQLNTSISRLYLQRKYKIWHS